MKPFKILFITQEDPFYVRLFFEEFFRIYRPLENIVGVVIAPAMGKKGLKKLAKQMIDFYGFWDFMRMGFKYVYYKAGDKLSQSIPLGRFYSIAQVCRYHHTSVKNCQNVNADSFLEEIRRIELDLIISVAAPQIFKEKLINIPRKGCINIHNSKLPKYRGMLPNFWQMFNGEKTIGTTIHRINQGIDDGEILLQVEAPIMEGETLDSIIRRTKQSGAKLMVDAIDGIKSGTLTPIKNSKEDATYYSFPTKEDVIKFRKKGYRLL